MSWCLRCSQLARQTPFICTSRLLSPQPLARTVPSHRTTLTVWEPDRKSGYKDRTRRDIEDVTLWKQFKLGMQQLPKEVRQWTDEARDKLYRVDPILTSEHGDYEILWKFNNQEIVNNWIVTTDNDMDEGFSQAQFSLGPNRTGLFRGYLDTEIPKDGIIKKTGYCNVVCPKKRISFGRIKPYDLRFFTHLLIRCRGDGRNYTCLLMMKRWDVDVLQNDLYFFPLFTRGGPYWQVAKIPLSKFFFTHKGLIQDGHQQAIDAENIGQIGIGLTDEISGPFQLEIDYIGAINDESHTEDFAYEMYSGPSYMFY